MRLSGIVHGLVDCNNFFASCERLFDPRLENRPIIVLSSNDGCIIARSNEAKALGIPMGAPVFEWRDVIRRHNVIERSGNHPLYGDLSDRVMRTIAESVADMRVYSIDEAFLRFGPHEACFEPCRVLRARIHRDVGIPVSIGLGPTRTLAKVAARFAKKDTGMNGVCRLELGPELDARLAHVEAGDLWGIGRQYAKLLIGSGIRTARAFRDLPDAWLLRHMGSTGLRVALELRGTSCGEHAAEAGPRKSVICSRSFGTAVSSRAQLSEAIASFVARAAETLRAEGLAAAQLHAYARASTHRYGEGWTRLDGGPNAGYASVSAEHPTNDTSTLLGMAERALDRLYRPDARYRKAGVTLTGLLPDTVLQGRLFSAPDPALARTRRALDAVDALNARWGSRTIIFAAEGVARAWRPKSQKRSPSYTTRWEDLPIVR